MIAAGGPTHANIPIIVVTAVDEYPKGVSHAVAYMRKPLDIPRLMKLIKHYLYPTLPVG